MSHVAVVNFPAIGHVNPNLAVVEELVRRGHEVTCTTTSHFVEAIKACGAEPLVYESVFGEFYRSPYTEDALQGEGMRCYEDSLRIVDVLEEHFGDTPPDLIAHDFMAWGGRFYASKHNLPTARFFPSYGINEHFSIQARFPLATFEDEKVIEMVGMLAATLPEFGIEGGPMDFFTNIPDLGIIFMPRSFHYDGETFDDRFVFAGPCLRDRTAFQGSWERPAGDSKVLLASMGTAATGWPEFFPTAVEAFGDTDWSLVMGTGDHTTADALGTLPGNVTASRHVPQLDVLAQASAFITHGGMNSVMEALYYDVPMVVIPQMNEQKANALRVDELGLGVHLERDDVTAATLKEAVDKVSSDADVAANLKAMRDEITTVDGPVVAADAIETQLRQAAV